MLEKHNIGVMISVGTTHGKYPISARAQIITVTSELLASFRQVCSFYLLGRPDCATMGSSHFMVSKGLGMREVEQRCGMKDIGYILHARV